MAVRRALIGPGEQAPAPGMATYKRVSGVGNDLGRRSVSPLENVGPLRPSAGVTDRVKRAIMRPLRVAD